MSCKELHGGIDLGSITHIIDHDIPLEKESYVHRTGRTGRAQSLRSIRAITNIPGVKAEDIGIIDILDHISYIDILNGKCDIILEGLKTMNMKGKPVRAQKAVKRIRRRTNGF